MPVDVRADKAEPVEGLSAEEEPEPLPEQPAVEAEPVVAEAVALVEPEPEPASSPVPEPEPADLGAVDREQPEPVPVASDALPVRAAPWWRRRRARQPEVKDGEPAALPEAVAVADRDRLSDDAESDTANPSPPQIIRLGPRPAEELVPVSAVPDGVAPARAQPSESPAAGPAVGAPTARHRLDPLPDPAPRRWPWRRRHDDRAVAVVPARPTGLRVLPGGSRRPR
jgi:hypothetical protein